MKLNISTEKQEIFIKSIMWNTIIEVFKYEKNIDISNNLISIQLRGNTILLKTNKPIINAEALILDNKIRDLFSTKMKKIGISFGNFEIKYI